MIKSHKRQSGFTLIESMVTVSIFSVIVGMSLTFYQRSHAMLQLSETESHMQMYSRQAMTKITKELRQASDYHEIPFENVPQAKEILFIRPNDNQQTGAVAQYILVRYWFHKSGNGVYSLLRGQKDHGNEIKFTTGDQNFLPDPDNSNDVHNFQIRALIKEAAVIEPGKQSYFHQDKNNPSLIGIRLVTATYAQRSTADLAGRTQEIKRQFRVDTSINARNL